ncbi:NAC domain [Arabidopsis thaliana x Arabidopsis arenosa]|nr:NAC domain [Arabidopsis thaliana x Arabidopsis arenosa]
MMMPERNKRKERSWPEPQTQPQSEIPSSSSSLAADNMSPPSTIAYVLPPGFKFMPNDKEVINCYLKPYSDGNTNVLLNVPIHRVNIYESNPQTLSGRNVATLTEDIGTQKWLPKRFKAGDGVVGNKRPLAYYVGKPSEGVKTDWLMQEYSLDHSSHNTTRIYLTPQATKKKKEMGEEKKKKKKEVGEEKKKMKKEVGEEKKKMKKEVGEEKKKKKKKQKKGEAAVSVSPVEASEDQQPCNAEYHQPLAPPHSCQPQPHDLAVQLDLHQPDQLQLQQPRDIVYQPQYCLLPEQDQPQPFPYNFSQLMIPDDLEDEESNNYDFFEGLLDTEKE